MPGGGKGAARKAISQIKKDAPKIFGKLKKPKKRLRKQAKRAFRRIAQKIG